MPIRGTMLLLNNTDRPGIVGCLGTMLAKHGVNIANMSLSRDDEKGCALTVFNLDSVPPEALIQELKSEKDISNVTIIQL